MVHFHSHLHLDIRGLSRVVWAGRGQIIVYIWSCLGHSPLWGAWGCPSILPCFLCCPDPFLFPDCLALRLFLSLNHSSAAAASPGPQPTLHTSLRSPSLLSAPLRLAPWAHGQLPHTHKAAGYGSPSSARALSLFVGVLPEHHPLLI